MQEIQYVITDEIGIHARPAGQVVKLAAAFASKIVLRTDANTADAKKLLSVMKLGARKGSTVYISAEGDDEEQAIKALGEFFSSNL